MELVPFVCFIFIIYVDALVQIRLGDLVGVGLLVHAWLNKGLMTKGKASHTLLLDGQLGSVC